MIQSSQDFSSSNTSEFSKDLDISKPSVAPLTPQLPEKPVDPGVGSVGDFYNPLGKQYNPDAAPSVYLIDAVLPGGKRGRKTNFEMSDYVRYDSIPEIQSFSFWDKEQGGGYFVYRGEKYDGEVLEDVPASDLGEVVYRHKGNKKSYDPSLLPLITEERQIEVENELQTQQTETISVTYQANPNDPDSVLTENKGYVNEIEISARNSNGQGDWTSASLIRRSNWSPEVYVADQGFTSRHIKGVKVDDYMSIYDFDRDKIKFVEISDLNQAPSSGYLKFRKQKIQGESLKIKTKKLKKLKYVPGDDDSQDELQFQASDGLSKGRIASAIWGLEKNEQPLLEVSDEVFEPTSTTVPAISFMQVDDLNEEDALKIDLVDENIASSSGYFVYNGEPIKSGELKDLSESDLELLSWVPGQPGVSDGITIHVSDSEFTVSDSITFSTNENQIPSLSVENADFAFAKAGDEIVISSLISSSSNDGDLIQNYEIKLLSKEGVLRYKDQSFDHDSKALIIASSDLDLVHFIPGSPGAKTDIAITATDHHGGSKTVEAVWGAVSDDESQEILKKEIAAIIKDKGTLELVKNISTDLKGLPEDFNGLNDNFVIPDVKDIVSDLDLDKKPQLTDVLPGLVNIDGIKFSDLDSLSLLKSSAEDSKSIAKEEFIKLDWLKAVPLFEEGTFKLKNNLLFREPWFLENLAASYSDTKGIGINERWGVGDLFEIKNEDSWNLFLGPDIDMRPRSWNPSLDLWAIEGGVKFNSGRNKLKAGLDITAGYGLGQIDVVAGGFADLFYSPLTGISVTSRFENPSLDLTFPYAYVNIDGIYDVEFQPSLKAWVEPFCCSRWTSPNVLGFMRVNTDNLDDPHNFFNRDTREHSGSSLSASLNVSGFTSRLSLPSFGDARRQNNVGSDLAENPRWRNATGNAVTWGIDDSQELMDFSLSLGQIATRFGIPLAYETSVGPADLKFTLADASLGVNAELDYNLSVSMKPNIYATVEGSDQRYDVISGFSVPTNAFNDVDDDGVVEVKMVVDPVIGFNISTGVDSDVVARFEALEARASISRLDWSGGVGPLLDSGNIDVGDGLSFEIFGESDVLALSDVSQGLVDSMTRVFEVPV